MSDSPDVALVHRAWEPHTRGDLSVIEAALAPDARWRAVQDGPWNCENRRAILDVMKRNLANGLRGRIEETIQSGQRILVAFRPEQPWQGERPLDDGIAYIVLTMRDGKIIEMKGCVDRSSALTYMETGQIRDHQSEAPTDTVRPPNAVGEPPAHRVDNLIPFVHVADVERSIAFYQHLGFVVTSIFEPGGHLVWASLESENAELMLQRASWTIDADQQAVLFYLYSDDLAALRKQLVTRGLDVGEIQDGTPGPRQEMRLADPDGYVLMVAQTERAP
jgi:ketosteroid isomerase-like protein/catechol 2,3-dioxygenase-like lactoylglutathione lyase family enzyme